MEILNILYKELTGALPDQIEPITGSGSNRRYYKITGPLTVIGTIGEDVKENESFIGLSRHFRSKGINVPEVLAVADDGSAYLQEYVGDIQLLDSIKSSGDNAEQSVEATIRMLPKIQYAGAEGLDFSICYPQPAFDSRMVAWDLNYFKYCFLKVSGVKFDEVRLQDDFDRLSANLLYDDFATFMYRDFQSRNIMLKDGDTPYFIDFQGGRKGPAEYDVASFLWQAKAGFSPDFRERMIDAYIEAAREYAAIDTAQFKARLRTFALFRMLQVLGAYGFRGLHERKQHFIESIPAALANARQLVEADAYPHLSEIIDALCEKYSPQPARDHLLVTVGSFSYKKGIPQDESGNGGGFVFDCRGMHNPGRYEQYKKLTGRNMPVIEFLEERGEVQPFLAACHTLVDHSVETYLRRGFTSLTAWFGCTGGQHRSVYCAEHLARHLADKFPAAEIRLIHREQGISETLTRPSASD